MRVLSNQARSKTSAIEANARPLLENYGGFLPRQGHEYAEQIKEASAQMEQLRQDLISQPRLQQRGQDSLRKGPALFELAPGTQICRAA